MSRDRTMAVVRRVLRQLRRDPRTLAMVFGIPPALLWLMDAILTNSPGSFDRVGPLMLGFFPFMMLFLITSISVLRERTQGTLDRLMASPIGRGDLLVGYAVAFTLVALAQAAIAMAVGIGLLDMPSEGGLALTFLIVIGQALLGITFGLFLSAFARTEFQAVQFLPAVVAPQFLLAGLLVPVERLPGWLEMVARVMPLTYAFEALELIMRDGRGLDDDRVLLDLAVIFGVVALALAAGALTLRRSEP
jgi:ABC-2 type transport system permease protein